MDTKQEYIEFMAHRYKDIVLKCPLFYTCKYALRFDLHGVNRNSYKIGESYFIEGLNRAAELFHKIFFDCQELYFLYRNGEIKFTDEIFTNITGLNKNEIGIINEKGIYDEDVETKLAIIKLSIDRINYKNILTAVNNTDFSRRKPSTDGEIYFIHIKDEIIFNMYDDRGLDIICTNKETIESYYENYNKWLLEYDRIKMEGIFK
jgi:hypothetical protein